MAFAHYLLSAPSETVNSQRYSISRVSPSSLPSVSATCSSILSHGFASSLWTKARNLSVLSNKLGKLGHKVKANPQESEATLAADALTQIKHILFPITDQNPFLSEGTRQAAATSSALAKKYGADITVVVIDESPKESLPEHDNKLSSIRWHLSEGGFQEFGLIERLGEGKKPTAIIGEVADDMNMDIVVMSMEAIHSKHVDANLLAEFIPCPVLLLPL